MILLNIIGIVLSIIGVAILFHLKSYIKQHANEELEAHKSFILSRVVVITVLALVAALLNLVAVLYKSV